MATIEVPVESTIDLSVDTPRTPPSGTYISFFDAATGQFYLMDHTSTQEQVFPTTFSGSVLTATQSIAFGVSHTFTGVPISNTLNILADVPIAGTQLFGSTFDTDSVTTLDANMINGDTTDLCYNNSAASVYPFNHVGIDLGSVQSIGSVVVWHWTNAAYTPSNWELQIGDTLGTLTSVVTGIDSTGKEGTSEEFFVSTTGRYIRPRIITSNNATFCVLSELEIYGTSPGNTLTNAYTIDGLVVESDGSGDLVLTNNTSYNPLTFNVYYMA